MDRERRLTEDEILAQARYLHREDIPALQSLIYAMIGGGTLARVAIANPRDFYLDSRAGKLPYTRRAILQAVRVLAAVYDLHHIGPEEADTCRVRLPNLGIF